MDKSTIQNIFWDVDGVLADLNYAYYHFLKGHPNYRDQYKGLTWEQLPEVLPIVPEYGALELKTHPEHGEQMDRDFCADQSFFRNRPLYPGVIETLKELNELGYRQFTMSATFNVEKKKAYLDTAKKDSLLACYQKYDLLPEETTLVDDRIYNLHAAIDSGAHPIRMRCEFTSDLPAELSWIPEFPDVQAFKEWLV
jgi:FMN phosphatase YigB (HAD superfamily)